MTEEVSNILKTALINILKAVYPILVSLAFSLIDII